MTPMLEDAVVEHMVGSILIQQSNLEKVLRLFRERFDKVVTSKITHILDMGTFIPIDTSKITKQDIMEALYSPIVLVNKIDGKIKGRAWSCVIKQRSYINK